MATYYLHVRTHAGAIAFATVGPYTTQEAAEQAAMFAKLVHWTVEERQHDQRAATERNPQWFRAANPWLPKP